jgi:alpha-beta hydrolase superfamily lysophospholipase
MGSFLARLYTVVFPETVDGLIIHGTGGPNPLAPVGKLIASVIKKLYGPRHKSKLITKMAFGSYNKKFPKEEGRHAWLTRDLRRVAGRDTDIFQNFGFTVSAYIDLFDMLIKCNKKEWFSAYPKDMPTLVISGDMDPVGNYGKGPKYVYEKLKEAGVKNVIEHSYPGARHELFNELCRQEVARDLIAFVNGVVQSA